MSFFDDASLAFLPSGAAGKDGKAYSIKPTDGTGDFTFSRGSNLAATRVGADGLIEKGRENLLLQSNNFDTTWTTARLSGLTSGQSGYDGSSDAWSVIPNTANDDHKIYQSISQTGVVTFSVYAKANGYNGLALVSSNTNNGKFFNLSNGTLGNDFNSSPIDSTITEVSNGWYRCEVVFNVSAGNFFTIYVSSDGISTHSFSGNGTNGIYIQDAQLEIGLAATDVISTGATTGKAGLLEDEPRFDYSGGATCPSLLLEPSRTNLVTQSEYFGDSSWFKGNVVATSNSVVSPEGVQNGTKVDFLAIANANIQRSPATPTTIGVDYTISFYARADAPVNNVKISSAGGDTDLTITTSWQRFTRKITATATSTATTLVTRDSVATTIYLYGFQVEAGSYATSYIPNHSGGSVTRGVEVCGKTGVSSLIGQSEGTIYWEGYIDVSKSNYGYFPRLFALSSTSANWMGLLLTQSNELRAQYVVGSSSDVSIRHQISTSGNYKVAFAYNDNDFNCFVNGVSVGTNTSVATTIALNDIYLGMENGATLAPTSQDTKQALLFDTRLSNTDLANLTTI